MGKKDVSVLVNEGSLQGIINYVRERRITIGEFETYCKNKIDDAIKNNTRFIAENFDFHLHSLRVDKNMKIIINNVLEGETCTTEEEYLDFLHTYVFKDANILLEDYEDDLQIIFNEVEDVDGFLHEDMDFIGERSINKVYYKNGLYIYLNANYVIEDDGETFGYFGVGTEGDFDLPEDYYSLANWDIAILDLLN